MNGLELLRGNRGLASGMNSAKSSFQGRRLSKATDAALARRVSRMGLTPLAVAEVTAGSSAAEQRGKSTLNCFYRDFLSCIVVSKR
jgi:hypothetical protein